MTLIHLLLRNIRFYLKSWMLTITGMMIGTAVLTGAFITGDSVRHSLVRMVELRLGDCRVALVARDRFFRARLAQELSAKLQSPVIPVLLSQGKLSTPEGPGRINKVQVIGVNGQFNQLWTGKPDNFSFKPDEVIISQNIAKRLKVKPGDDLILRMAMRGFAPGNAPFIAEKPEITAFRLKVKTITTDDTGGRFSLQNDQVSPFNLFVDISFLSGKLGIPGFANVLLVSGINNIEISGLNKILKKTWKPEDAGLFLSSPEKNLFQMASRRVFIEDTLVKMISRKIPDAAGIVTYLVNDFSCRQSHTPYSFVTAAPSGTAPEVVMPGKMVINQWLSEDLKAKPGDSVRISFWTMGTNHTLRESAAVLQVQSIAGLSDSPGLRALMPDFPGMMSSGSCRDWETGVPVDLKKIRPEDEAYWKKYRGTPKAWIAPEDGRRLWGNPFGTLTSIRFNHQPLQRELDSVMQSVEPASLGLQFTPVAEEGIQSATRSTDFGELFLSLGGLIVLSGLLLSGMMFSLFLHQRKREIGLLRVLGFRQRQIRLIYFAESWMVVLVSSLSGVLLAVFYSELIISALNTLWKDAVNTSSLGLFITPEALAKGLFISLALNLWIFIVVLVKWTNPQRQSGLLNPVSKSSGGRWRKNIFFRFLAGAALLAAIILPINEMISGRFYSSVSFMISGCMMMLALLVFLSDYLALKSSKPVSASTGIRQLSIKNAALRKKQSLGTIVLLCLGFYTVLVSGLNRLSLENEISDTGTGGFSFWIETTAPLPNDLDTKTGRNKAGIEGDTLLNSVSFFPLPLVSGDDASCLNLNQVKNPALLGVPVKHFSGRQGFSWIYMAPGQDEKHPWEALEKTGAGNVINGYADQTVITWGLRKKVGDTIEYTDEQGRKLYVRLAGGLDNSIFQGNVLISDSLLRLYFPSGAKTVVTLAETSRVYGDSIANLLENRWSDQGAVIYSTVDRLNSFHSVENTYLDVFIVLGGFGLLIGIFGFTTLVIRNLYDRQDEWFLYYALGFSEAEIIKTARFEFSFLFFAGAITGVSGATWSTIPTLIQNGGATFIYPGSILGILVLLAVWKIRRITGLHISVSRNHSNP